MREEEEEEQSAPSILKPSPIQRPAKIPRVGSEWEDGGEELADNEMVKIKNPNAQRYLVAIEYIGTRFAGAQQQPNQRTVVGVLQALMYERIPSIRPKLEVRLSNPPIQKFGPQRNYVGRTCINLPKRRYAHGVHFKVCHWRTLRSLFGGGCSRGRLLFGSLFAEAFHKFIGQPVAVFCSSRTDTGVHALSNVCHIDVERISKRNPGDVLEPHDPAVVKRAINHFLQKNEGDIMVTDVRCVAPTFHARYKAQERTYFYRLLSGPEPLSIFEKDRAWHVPEDLDILVMQRACKVLVGHHDFSSFRAASCQAKSPIRLLEELNVTEVVSTPYFPSIRERGLSNCIEKDVTQYSNSSKAEPTRSLTTNQDELKSSNGEVESIFGMRKRHRCYVVTARSRSFLYHQVRLLVGVLKCAGTGEITLSDVERILNAKTVSAASPMAPACGLYLGNVKYELS